MSIFNDEYLSNFLHAALAIPFAIPLIGITLRIVSSPDLNLSPIPAHPQKEQSHDILQIRRISQQLPACRAGASLRPSLFRHRRRMLPSTLSDRESARIDWPDFDAMRAFACRFHIVGANPGIEKSRRLEFHYRRFAKWDCHARADASGFRPFCLPVPGRRPSPMKACGPSTISPPPRSTRNTACTIDQAWLDRVRGASVRLSTGCSASVVTGDGLVLTNHHCVRDCAQQLSTATTDYVKDGFPGRQARGRETLLRHAGRCPVRHHRRHRPRHQGRRRQDRPGFRAGARRRDRGHRKGQLRRQGRQIPAARSSRSIRAASTSSTPTANIPMCGWCSRRKA